MTGVPLRGGHAGLGQLSPAAQAAWGLLSVVSAGASAFHGYRRNKSVGWAIVWGMLGGLFPVITPAVAFAQGFGKPRPGLRGLRSLRACRGLNGAALAACNKRRRKR